jgi:four helix bundle protein
MTFKEWMETVPDVIRKDPVWRVEAYRLALFAGDLAWQDASRLITDKRTISLADQLNRSAGAVSCDICEGYSRRSGKDQARFYEYGLGSAREARDWYYKGRHVLGERVCRHRLELLTQIIKSLLVIVPTERGFKLQEEAPPYSTTPAYLIDDPPLCEDSLPLTTHESRIADIVL